MRRSTIICLIFLLFFSLGFRLRTVQSSNGTSKIYLYGSTLARAVPGTEIGLYDISNPASPQQKSRIAITGNHDMAVQSHYMYADNNYDLVIYDIADIAKPVALDTIYNAFTTIPEQWMQVDPVMGNDVVTGSSGCQTCNESPTESTGTAIAPTADRSNGEAGSATRFAIVGNYLYCVDASSLKVFDISEPARPQYKSSSQIGWDIETIFPYEDKLFIGGQRGMYVYGTGNPDLPVPLGEFTHARSCDPVVAEGNRAYVTLRSGSPCGDNSDQLDILDVSDVRNPKLLKSMLLTNPYGLSVKDGNVVVCDGTAGLVIIDANDANNPKKIGAVTGIVPHDVIIEGNLMIVTADTGVFLYDISTIASPVLYNKLVF